MILGKVFHDVTVLLLYIHLLHYDKSFWEIIFYFLFFPNKVLMVLHLIQNLQPFSVFTIQ
jgi:hypothetical protein